MLYQKLKEKKTKSFATHFDVTQHKQHREVNPGCAQHRELRAELGVPPLHKLIRNHLLY